MRQYAWWGALAGAGMGLGFALASYYPIGQRVASDDKPVSPQPEELNDAVNASAHE